MHRSHITSRSLLLLLKAPFTSFFKSSINAEWSACDLKTRFMAFLLVMNLAYSWRAETVSDRAQDGMAWKTWNSECYNMFYTHLIGFFFLSKVTRLKSPGYEAQPRECCEVKRRPQGMIKEKKKKEKVWDRVHVCMSSALTQVRRSSVSSPPIISSLLPVKSQPAEKLPTQQAPFSTIKWSPFVTAQSTCTEGGRERERKRVKRIKRERLKIYTPEQWVHSINENQWRAARSRLALPSRSEGEQKGARLVWRTQTGMRTGHEQPALLSPQLYLSRPEFSPTQRNRQLRDPFTFQTWLLMGKRG